MKREIQLSVPNLNMEIIDNLKECIETGWVSTGGRFIQEFEDKIAKYVKTEDAVSTQSGTAGLHLALHVLGVREGDEVIVPTLTFIAAVNPVKYIGADPVFMDCDDSLCIDAEKLESFCREQCYMKNESLINTKTGKRIVAIIVVHVFGNLANMERIMDIAKTYHLKVLEDATEALGSFYKGGRYAGCFSGTIGDIGVYSFNANKIITTGGGGMIVSHQRDLLKKMRHLSLTAKSDHLFFVHDEVGFNYRMLNIQAALGVSQFDELEHFIQIKVKNYLMYKELISDIEGITILPFKSDTRSNYWFYSLLIDENIFGTDRDGLMQNLIKKGIQCRPIWKLIHTLNPYLEYQCNDILNAPYYEKNVLNIPCSTNLREEEIMLVCKHIKSNNQK